MRASTTPARLDRMVWLPFDWYDREEADALKERLTVRARKLDHGEDKWYVEEIEQYVIDRETKMVGVPIDYGLQLLHCEGYTGLKIETNLGLPIDCPKRPDPNHPNAPKGQAELMDKALKAVRERMATLIESPTGTGKTVVALNTAAEIGRTTLIVVPNKVLANQWCEEIEQHLGIPYEDVGRIEEGTADFFGREIVVAVIHNLVQKTFRDELYWYFGTIIWDEAHNLGAPTFSKSMQLFAADKRIALTATPTRRDGAENLFLDYFGESSVAGVAEVLPCECRVISRTTRVPNFEDMPKSRLLSALTMNKSRNTDIALLIEKMYSLDRVILVLSDRIRQLQVLMRMCEEKGIPELAMGLYTRKRYKGRKEVKHTAEHLADVLSRARVVFATYQMAEEGFDHPVLDLGIDASPRGYGVQAVGRIRRPYPKKPKPVWFTLRDIGIPSMVTMTEARIKDYRTAQVEIKDDRP